MAITAPALRHLHRAALFAFSILFASPVTMSATPQSPEARELVVLTMNLRCRVDGWAERRPRLIVVMERLRPDLTAFEEDCRDPATGRSQAQDLGDAIAQRLGRRYHYLRAPTHEARHAEGAFDEGLSMFSAFPIMNAEVLQMPSNLYPRRAIRADVEIDGKALRFVATHLDYGEDAAQVKVRVESAEKIMDDLPAGSALIVAGDLNMPPDDGAMERFRVGLTDAWAQLRPHDAGLTFPAQAPDRRIDYILVSAQLVDGLRAIERIPEDATTAPMSDHRGLWTRIAWPN